MTFGLVLLLATTGPWPTGGFVQEPPKPKAGSDASRDCAVLEVVLKDLFTWPDSPIEPGREARKQILFSPEAPAYRPGLEEILDRKDVKEWNKISPVQLGLAREAARDLVHRLGEKETFKGFWPNDKRILISDESGAPPNYDPLRAFRPQVFRAYAPGYSRDGQLAIVRLTLPWSDGVHSGNGTYVLTMNEGDWVVLTRVFVYYRSDRTSRYFPRAMSVRWKKAADEPGRRIEPDPSRPEP
jgi:hypothetical protein